MQAARYIGLLLDKIRISELNIIVRLFGYAYFLEDRNGLHISQSSGAKIENL